MACPMELDLVAFAKGELTPSEQEKVRLHLPTCVDCQEELDAVEDLFGGMAAMPSVTPSADFAARVTRALAANPEYAKLARETRRREKEETIRRHGWTTWAGKSLRERVSSAPGWVAAAAVYLVTFGVLAWVLIPKDDKPHRVADNQPGEVTPVAPPRPGGDGTGDQAESSDPLAPGGRLLFVDSRTSEASRKQVTDEVAKAIERGLGWLVSQQAQDGSWASGNVGTTALATLALLGDAHRSSGGKHRDVVTRAQAWLKARQGSNGAFDEDPYVHALATIAAIEDLAFGVADKADTAETRKVVESAIGFCRTSQLEDGSWGRLISTAKNVEALRLAKALGVKKCEIPLERAKAYLAKAERTQDVVGGEVAAWSHACAWADTTHRVREYTTDQTDADGLAHCWLGTDEDFLGGSRTETDLGDKLFLNDQAEDGSWPATSPGRDTAALTALHILILEAPYRVVRLPRAK